MPRPRASFGRRRAVATAAVALLLGCSGTIGERSDTPAWLPADSHAGVENPALAALLDEHWAWELERFPTFATRLGVREFDAQLEDESDAAIRRARERLYAFGVRARAVARNETLSPADAVTAEVFASGIERDLATQACEFHLWSLDPHLGNVLHEINAIAEYQTVRTLEDGRNLVARYRAIPATLAQHIDNLKLGVSRGYVANAMAVSMLADTIEEDLAKPESPMLRPLENAHAGWSDAAEERFARELRDAVENAVQPALRGYAEFLRSEILPVARPAGDESIAGIPGGAACYAARVAQQTTLPGASPEALHETGLDELARIGAEMLTIGKAELGVTDRTALMDRLREDASLNFASEEEIVEKAERALAAARDAMPRFFGRLPAAPCEVLPVPAYRAPATPAGYYDMFGPPDARVGRYYVNTYLPRTRPRFGIESLTFHESIPGHHLQIALSRELGAMPAFRKYSVSVAFSEGWGLYAERLALDMGLYSGPLDRLGQLNNEAWRAARLVLDTGIHAKGWSRVESVEFMLQHTALARHDTETEVGRYIANPGQALAYKVGQREIERLREDARRRLGERFDLRGFHDALLLGGALPLPIVEQRVEAWVRSHAGAS